MINKLVAIAVSAALWLEPGAPLILWAAERSTLDSVEVGMDQVTLHLSDQVKYNTFVTAEPPRLVIELLNTEHEAPTKSQEGQGTYLKRVRSGQFQREPSLITRIVLDLAKAVEYKTAWSGKDMVVQLNPGSEQRTRTTAASEKTKANPAKSAQAAEATKVAKPARDEQQMPAPASTEQSPELSRIAAASDTADVERVEAPRRKSSRSSIPADSTRYTRRDILATLPIDPITLDFDNTDIRDILKLLATKANVNIIYGVDVAGALTLHITDVPFNEAFTTILQMQGLVANQVGENILRVMTPATLQKERTVAVSQTRVIQLKYSKATDIKRAIDAVRTAEGRQGNIVIDDKTNSIIVTDTIDGIASVERLLAQLDTRPKQVMIEAKLVEVKLTNDLNFGIQWDYLSSEKAKIGGQSGTNLIGTLIPPAAASSPSLNPLDMNANTAVGAGATGRGTGVNLPSSSIFGAFTFGRVTNNYFLSATLTAAASKGKVKVLSDPKIATLSGKLASINITTQIPYVTSNVTSTGVATQTVAYITTGITLNVTPTINADGRVTMDVNPTVSQPSTTAAASTTGAPAVDSRTAQTTVLVQDGETVVIGGLITDSLTNTTAKVPLLGDIPILGWLFKKKSVSRSRVELLIFVTPKIIET